MTEEDLPVARQNEFVQQNVPLLIYNRASGQSIGHDIPMCTVVLHPPSRYFHHLAIDRQHQAILQPAALVAQVRSELLGQLLALGAGPPLILRGFGWEQPPLG